MAAVKSVSGGTHGSFFKRSLLLDTVVAKAAQRQTTTLQHGATLSYIDAKIKDLDEMAKAEATNVYG